MQDVVACNIQHLYMYICTAADGREGNLGELHLIRVFRHAYTSKGWAKGEGRKGWAGTAAELQKNGAAGPSLFSESATSGRGSNLSERM